MSDDPVLDELLRLQAALDAEAASAEAMVADYQAQLQAAGSRDAVMRIFETIRAKMSVHDAMDIAGTQTVSWGAVAQALLQRYAKT